MPSIKVSELSGAALDWAVAQCEGINQLIAYNSSGKDPQVLDAELVEMGFDGTATYNPSIDWSQGGPIIEMNRLQLRPMRGNQWDAYAGQFGGDASGPTPLIAAMHCYVAFKLGESIDVPEPLTTKSRP